MIPVSSFNGTKIKVWVGRVLEDKVLHSTELKVFIPELFPDASGMVAPAEESSIITTQNPDGSKEDVSSTTSNYITCSWLGGGDDFYAPWVRKGEQVLIYQFNDSKGKYLWSRMERDREVRKTDIKRIYVSAKSTLHEDLDDGNIYFFELNSYDQTVTLKTSKANGETVRYAMTFDCKDGTFVLVDDYENSIYLNSKEKILSLTNADKSTFTLQGEDAFISAVRDLTLKSGRQTVLDTPILTTRNSSGSGITKMQFKELSLEGQSLTLDAPILGLNGQVTTSSSLLVGGGVFAQGYSVGTGVTYTPATTNIEEGTGLSGKNTPNVPEDAGGLRHTTAHEDFLECITAIQVQLEALNAPDPNSIMPPATAAFMPKNKGE
jgi:hypothetical protein